MGKVLGLVVGLLIAFLASADGVVPAERRVILEAIGISAAREVGQSVKVDVSALNVDSGWAVLVGELVAADGGPLDWATVKGCEEDLDRMLWAVVALRQGQWQIEQLAICAAEPPWWYLKEEVGLIWPCGVYVGMEGDSDGTLEEQCRRQSPSVTPAAPN